MPLAVAPWVVYLGLPFSVNPLFILLPCAARLLVVKRNEQAIYLRSP